MDLSGFDVGLEWAGSGCIFSGRELTGFNTGVNGQCQNTLFYVGSKNEGLGLKFFFFCFVLGSGLGLIFLVCGLGFRGLASGFRVSGFRFRVQTGV